MTNSPIEVRAESADIQDDVKKLSILIKKKKAVGERPPRYLFFLFIVRFFFGVYFIYNDKFKDLRGSAVITSSKHRQDIIIHITA